jgi:hypothetical protein
MESMRKFYNYIVKFLILLTQPFIHKGLQPITLDTFMILLTQTIFRLCQLCHFCITKNKLKSLGFITLCQKYQLYHIINFILL